jgi:exodeoxyribonuclease VII large subunit
VLRVSRERCPVRIVVAPCLVQGADAPRSIVRALRALQSVRELDVVIVARGGGGAEDLSAFNDEAVARAIAACRVPVVTGIGHETDTTVADLVADVRAATPSNAAETVVPEHDVLGEQLNAQVRRLSRALETRIARERLSLARLTAKLRHPRRLLGRSQARLDALDQRAARAIEQRLERARAQLELHKRRLAPRDPRARLSAQRAAFERVRARLELGATHRLAAPRRALSELSSQSERAMRERLAYERHAFVARLARLHALSPLAVLSRGYAIAFLERTGKALCRAEEARPGDALRLRLHAGELRAQVLESLPPAPVADAGAARETPPK